MISFAQLSHNALYSVHSTTIDVIRLTSKEIIDSKANEVKACKHSSVYSIYAIISIYPSIYPSYLSIYPYHIYLSIISIYYIYLSIYHIYLSIISIISIYRSYLSIYLSIISYHIYQFYHTAIHYHIISINFHPSHHKQTTCSNCLVNSVHKYLNKFTRQ